MSQDQLPVDYRLWPRHELVNETLRLEARVDELITALAELQRENRDLRTLTS